MSWQPMINFFECQNCEKIINKKSSFLTCSCNSARFCSRRCVISGYNGHLDECKMSKQGKKKKRVKKPIIKTKEEEEPEKRKKGIRTYTWEDVQVEVKKLKIGEKFYIVKSEDSHGIDVFYERLDAPKREECINKPYSTGGSAPQSRYFASTTFGSICPSCGSKVRCFSTYKSFDSYSVCEGDEAVCMNKECGILRNCQNDGYTEFKEFDFSKYYVRE